MLVAALGCPITIFGHDISFSQMLWFQTNLSYSLQSPYLPSPTPDFISIAMVDNKQTHAQAAVQGEKF